MSFPLIRTVLGRGSMSSGSEIDVSFLFGSSVYCGIGFLVFFCYLSEESEQRDDSFFKFCKNAAVNIGGAVLGASIPFCGAFAMERMLARMLGY